MAYVLIALYALNAAWEVPTSCFVIAWIGTVLSLIKKIIELLFGK